MDPVVFTAAVANLIALGMITGAVLLFPTARRLGVYLEVLIEERRKGTPSTGQIARLEAELRKTQEELRVMSERQQFVEALLEEKADVVALPQGSASPRT
jgi:hypothetical protein